MMYPLRCFPLLLLAVAPMLGAERDLLDLVPPGARYVQVQRPVQFRGTPLADSWADHPLGAELPEGGVKEVVSVGGILEDASASYTLFLLRVEPFILRKFARRASYVEPLGDETIYIAEGEDDTDTIVVGSSVMIRGDQKAVAAALERVRGEEAGTLPPPVRSRLGVLRERSLTCTWLLPPHYPFGPEGPESIEEQVEILIGEAYSTIRWADGWIESREEFVTESPENAAKLADLIRKVVQGGASSGEDTQFTELLREYHRNFGESATVAEEGNAVRLSVQLSPEQFAEMRQEMEEQPEEGVVPEAREEPLP